MEDVRVQNIFERLVQEDNLHFGFDNLSEKQKQDLFNDHQKNISIIRTKNEILQTKFLEIYNSKDKSLPVKYVNILALLNDNIPGNKIDLKKEINSVLISAITATLYAKKFAETTEDVYIDARKYRNSFLDKIATLDETTISEALNTIKDNPSILLSTMITVFTHTEKKESGAYPPERYSYSKVLSNKRLDFMRIVEKNKINLNELYYQRTGFLSSKGGFPFTVSNSFVASIESLLTSLTPRELICNWKKNSHWKHESSNNNKFAFYNIPMNVISKTNFDELSIIKGVSLYMENKKSYVIVAINEIGSGNQPTDPSYIQPVILRVTGGCREKWWKIWKEQKFKATPMFAADFRGRPFLYENFLKTLPKHSFIELVHCYMDQDVPRKLML